MLSSHPGETGFAKSAFQLVRYIRRIGMFNRPLVGVAGNSTYGRC